MIWSDLIALVKVEHQESAILQERCTKIYANKLSVTRSEFYQAIANDLKPEVTFEIHEFEYCNEQKLIHEGKAYLIIRTFSKNNDILELVCQAYEDVETNLAKLRERVEIWHWIEHKNEMHEIEQHPQPLFTVFAEIIPQSGTERTQIADTVDAIITHKLTIQYRDGIRPDMFLRYEDRRLDIRYIINANERNETLEIYAEEVID